MKCDICLYGQYRRMPPREIKKASLVIVGEAPADSDITQGQPFTGPSGDLLKKTLVKFGITDYSNIHITNALMCRPPKKKQPSPTAVRNCQERLIKEIKAVAPETVICLGKLALWSVVDDFSLKITQEQGRLIESPLLPGTKVIGCLNPSAILHSPGQFKTFHKTLGYAVSVWKGDKPKGPGETKFVVVDTEDKAKRAVDYLLTNWYNFLTADIETTGLKPWSNEILALGVGYEKNKVIIFPADMIQQAKPLFEAKHIKWGWQNGKFDVGFLRRRGIPARVDEDSMLLHYCLNETTGTHDLEQLATIYLGAAAYKSGVKEAASVSGRVNYADVPEDLLYEYLAKDVDYTFQLIKLLREEVDADKDLKNLYEKILIPASETLRQIERKGMYINLDALYALEEKLQDQIAEVEEKIQRLTQDIWNPDHYMAVTGAKTAKLDFLPTSTKQLAYMLYDVYKLKPKKRKGRSTGEDIIEEFREAIPLVDLVLKLRSAKKNLSTYIEGPMKRMSKDSRVHTVYKIHGTATGRLSSVTPNVQNIPRDPLIRGVYQAPPGYLFMEFDYKGAELRTLAHFSRDPFLTRVFAEGRDLHDEVSKILYGPDFTKDQRVRAKAVNFGIPYGREAFSIAKEYNFSTTEAQKIIDDWLSTASGAKKFLEACAQAARDGEVITTPFGRKRRFGLITQENIHTLEKEARNFPIQSVTTDFTLLSGIEAQEAIKQFTAWVINLVHDSILTEVKLQEVSKLIEMAKTIVAIMMDVPRKTLGATIPFEVEVKIGTVWGSLTEIKLDSPTLEEDINAIIRSST